MSKFELTKEELKQLSDELFNTKNGRLKEIKNAVLIISISVLSAVGLWFFAEQIVIAHKLMAITYFGMVFGLYKCYWWYVNASTDKLESDIRNGLKIQDESKVKSYNKRTHTVKLNNGFKMDDFDIQQESWNIGDRICYTYTPKQKYILKTEIQSS